MTEAVTQEDKLALTSTYLRILLKDATPEKWGHEEVVHLLHSTFQVVGGGKLHNEYAVAKCEGDEAAAAANAKFMAAARNHLAFVLDEVDRLKLELADRELRLQVVAGNVEAVKSLTLSMDEDGANVKLRHWAVPMIAASFEDFFKANGGTNYVEVEVQGLELGPLVVTVQRKLGKTPATFRREAEEELEKLRAFVHGLRFMRPTPKESE